MSPPKDKFQVSNVPVVLKWDDCDGDVKYLGHRSAVTLDIRLDVPRHTASFKLRTIASLKSLAQRVPLYLFIQPDRVASLAEDDGPIQQPVKDGLIQTRKCAAITEILRLRFSLEHGALSAVGPAEAGSPPVPKTGPSARILDGLRSIRQATGLSIYLPHSSISPNFLDALCANAKGGKLQPVHGEAETLYSGQGGREMEWPADADAVRGESPPSYDELGPSPPPPRKRTQSDRASLDREERPRKKASDSTDRTSPAGRAYSQKLEQSGHEWSSGVDQRMSLLSEQLEALKKAVGITAAELAPSESISASLARLESEMKALRSEVAEANSRWKEVAEQLRDQPSLEDLRIEIMEDVEERLAQTRGEITEDLELKVDERFLTTKEELRETVEEELELVEERIKEDLSSGRAEFYVEFPR